MTPLDIALGYIARGWNPVPIPYRTKGPTGPGWQARIVTEETAPRYFEGNGALNIGVVLGPSSGGLTDIDLDCAEAIALAPYVLPPTEAKFGRASKRASHWLYTTDLATTMEKAVLKLSHPESKDTLVELRVGGTNGAQTVFPGSIHEGGEAIAWEHEGEPDSVDGEELRRAVRALAAYSLVLRHWPSKGSRHDAACVLGGFLSRAGKTSDEIAAITDAIARAAHDSEPRDRRDAAKAAAEAHEGGQNAYGLTAMREMFGREVADKMASWLDYGESDAQLFDKPTIATSTEVQPVTLPSSEQHQQEPATPLIQSSTQFTGSFVPPDPLIAGILQRRFIYALTGHTGRGKTALALLFAACIALGRRLGEHDVEQGRVLILAGENPVDAKMRWIAMSQQMQFDRETIDVHWIEGTFKISTQFARIRREIEALGGVDLIIVDSSAAFFEGDDENNNPQQGVHARRLRSLTTLAGGPCVLVLCHPPKNAGDDNLQPRGAGSYIAEIDGNLTVTKDDMAVELHWQGKLRGPDFAPVNFLLRSVTHEELKDTKGKLIPTIVAQHLSDIAQEEMTKAARCDEDLLLQVLSKNPRGSVADLAKNLGWYVGGSNKPHKSKAHRILARLQRDKLIKKERGRFEITDKGHKALGKGLG